MRRIFCCLGLLFAAVLIASLLKPVPVGAITYGFVDTNNTYSNVGAFIVESPSGEIFPICSGTLITPDVFLTASHCTQFFTSVLEPTGYTAYVRFDKSIPFGSLTTSKTKLYEVETV